jgi:hypothetical protein
MKVHGARDTGHGEYKRERSNHEGTKIGKHPSEMVLAQFHGTGEKGPFLLSNPSSFVFSYPAKLTAGKPTRQTAGKLRVFVMSFWVFILYSLAES